jgi:hypothetical protein
MRLVWCCRIHTHALTVVLDEREYIDDLRKVELISVLKPKVCRSPPADSDTQARQQTAEVWLNSYHTQWPASDRDFALLILLRESPPETPAGQRYFSVVQLPYSHPEQKGYVRAKVRSPADMVKRLKVGAVLQCRACQGEHLQGTAGRRVAHAGQHQ